MEIGLYTFGELGPGASHAQRIRELVEEMALADQVDLDVFGVGEHHRPDFVVSSPAVVLAAGAERTKGIRLTSAVSVISSDDPVRVFQNFATLDLVSDGRVVFARRPLVGAGLCAVLFPAAFLKEGNIHFEITVSRPLVLGLVVLLTLLNTYLVSRRLEIRRLREELISRTIQQELVQQQSFTDPLTEIYNRHSLPPLSLLLLHHRRKLTAV